MTSCTCTKDKEATCIVHPTIRSLKDCITALEQAVDAVLEAELAGGNDNVNLADALDRLREVRNER